MSHKKTVVAQSKAELVRICDQFNIQVDNPIVILTQQTAKTFLTNSTEKSFYKVRPRAWEREYAALIAARHSPPLFSSLLDIYPLIFFAAVPISSSAWGHSWKPSTGRSTRLWSARRPWLRTLLFTSAKCQTWRRSLRRPKRNFRYGMFTRQKSSLDWILLHSLARSVCLFPLPPKCPSPRTDFSSVRYTRIRLTPVSRWRRWTSWRRGRPNSRLSFHGPSLANRKR